MDEPSGSHQGTAARSAFRPQHTRPIRLSEVAELLGLPHEGMDDVELTGVSLDSRSVEVGDLYVAVPGSARHGASFVPQAIESGAVAVLTDEAGAHLLAMDDGESVPVLVVDDARAAVGPVAALVFENHPGNGSSPLLLGVTGTNGKTTTTYFANSLFQALGHRTGLIGTIEIVAGGEPIPSRLTTPESTDVHALLALMREKGVTAASMEVSSHAIEYRRVDGVRYDAVGFTNLTQDHLDLHVTMEDYFAAKARLFTPERATRGVVVVDDSWGRRLADSAPIPVTTLSLAGNPADWRLTQSERWGLGTAFELAGPDGQSLRLRTGLPGAFNVANAALAALLVHAAGIPLERIQRAADDDPFSVEVPGRMQLVGTRPAAVVDFAHNPDALERALDAVRPADGTGRVIIVFGATGQRDQTKRPLMGAVAARGADVVIVTDDDPHDEDPAAIRQEVLEGARNEDAMWGLHRTIEEVAPRAAAIRRAVEVADEDDVVLVAGRGHEVFQEVKGINHALDDRVELRAALVASGFLSPVNEQIESTTDD
ncbi:UDP-N-acetylmuramoylalanyl-D-glutamate--2,6-diaminopimelate ligase [Sinomonas humi]|uniref:UDP-N-acetylmuramyl-tripeptide synthetase n=1 Tax=Sinomonas humi TaxID=1338436 RepID=A0A0B2AMS3_9MICC|nr:UDP-N-acetylmuramoylalanyl-D-glutamate--2,6-diaminopimelate ligase [Sinomonas humi]